MRGRRAAKGLWLAGDLRFAGEMSRVWDRGATQLVQAVLQMALSVSCIYKIALRTYAR